MYVLSCCQRVLQISAVSKNTQSEQNWVLNFPTIICFSFLFITIQLGLHG